MTDIVVDLTLAGALVNALGDDPEISIMRLDTFALPVSGVAMTDTGALGKYHFAFTAVAGRRYSFTVDADPATTGQVDVRFHKGTFDRETLDIWRARGLDPANPKTTTEVTEDVDYDEDAGDVHIDQVKVGAVTTATRV